jgi:uncharacterized protein
MESILITGGNGLIGKHLCKKLSQLGYNVSVLSRAPLPNSPYKNYYWNVYKKEIDDEAIAKADYIIHLAGANLADGRWTKKRKQLIIDSRVKSAELIYQRVKESNKALKGFISSSAIGYYGAITSEKIFKEEDLPNDDFLSKVCKLWEDSADNFYELGIRTVKIRTGIVLTPSEGPLAKISAPVKLGIGSPLGIGNQFMPWIHIDDLCDIYIKSIVDKTMKGAFNAVAPEHKTNDDFTKAVAKVMNKSLFMPKVPSFLLKLLFGEMSVIILNGSRVSSEKICSKGFEFKFPKLEDVLRDLLKSIAK